MTRRTAASAAAAVALFATAPAYAAGGTAALCAERFTATLSPPLTMTARTGTVASNGQTGSMRCAGRIAGGHITGPGSIGTVQTYSGASCTSQVNTGIVRLVFPTTAGVVDISGPVTVWRTGLAIRVEAHLPSVTYRGAGVVIPTLGTCFVTPLRKVLVSVEGSLSGP